MLIAAWFSSWLFPDCLVMCRQTNSLPLKLLKKIPGKVSTSFARKGARSELTGSPQSTTM